MRRLQKSILSVVFLMSIVVSFLGEEKSAIGQDNKDYLKFLSSIWKSQKEEIVAAKIKYKGIRGGPDPALPMGYEELLKLLQLEDNRARLKYIQNLSKSQTPWDECEFVMEGSKARVTYHGAGFVHIFDGNETLEYDGKNKQVVMDGPGVSNMYLEGIDTFRMVPSLDGKFKVEVRNGLICLGEEEKSGDVSCELTVEPDTAAVRRVVTKQGGKLLELTVQDFFVMHPKRIFFPSFCLTAKFDADQKLSFVDMKFVEQASFNNPAPVDAFRLAVPAGVNIFDNRFKKKTTFHTAVELVDAVDYSSSISPAKPFRPWWLITIAILGSLVIVVQGIR